MSLSICTLAMSSSATSNAVAGIWAQALADQLVSFLGERGIDLANVRVVEGDGTNSVVGYNGGWMAKLEALLGRPLTRVVCLCHQAELPYRALVRALDGRMTSKSTFEGPIGQMLAGPVHELPLVEFQPLTSIKLPLLPTEVEKSLSSDMRLLFQCAKCATTGDGALWHCASMASSTRRGGTRRKAACCVFIWRSRAPAVS